MDTSSFMLEDIHFPQQSRRDKLRTHHDYNDAHSNNMNNHHLPPGTICYDPSGFCSEISNFSEKHENFNHPSDTVMINRDPQQSYFSTWKSIGSQPASTADSNFWVAVDQTPNFVGQGVSGNSDSSNNNNNNRTMPTFDVKPYSNLGYQDHLHSHLGSEISGHKQYGDEHMHCGSGSASFYHNALQELVSTSGVRSFVPASSLRQKSSEGELLLLPAYGDQLGLRGSNDLISRPVRQWNNTLDFAAVKENTYANTQALSLSLSSVPSPKVHATQVAERSNAMDLCETRDFSGNTDHVQDFRTWKPEHLPNLAMTGSKVLGDDRQDMMGSRVLTTHRNPGPLGPFTGYATVLRNSKFLRPAQILLEELLEELCGVARPYHKDIGICEEPRDKILEEIRVSGEAVSNRETGTKVIAVDPSGSLFGFNGPDDKNPESGGGGGWMESYRPENHQKKAKLLCMQDEVCKKYKQYHQQMQMVVSSFESVAGLSVAAPYVSLALKMVSKHFRCLKNAIMDQIKSIRNALGEELSSPLAGTSNAGVPMLKFFNQSFQRQRGASGLGILEGQHIWRPQRGLPERAVSILRAWLFDHFLHPYPTDADKHMLAAQTGLTRNQVSNWFINARVRVWKPMVEEIHMLETKGTADTELNVKTTPTDCDQTNSTAGQCSSNTYRTSKMLADSYSNLDPSQPSPGNRLNASASWNNQEKRSRIEYHHVPTSLIGGSVMGFQGIGVEVAGPSAVSLTLGLRQSAENNGQRPHYGGQIIGDFVG